VTKRQLRDFVCDFLSRFRRHRVQGTVFVLLDVAADQRLREIALPFLECDLARSCRTHDGDAAVLVGELA